MPGAWAGAATRQVPPFTYCSPAHCFRTGSANTFDGWDSSGYRAVNSRSDGVIVMSDEWKSQQPEEDESLATPTVPRATSSR